MVGLFGWSVGNQNVFIILYVKGNSNGKSSFKTENYSGFQAHKGCSNTHEPLLNLTLHIMSMTETYEIVWKRLMRYNLLGPNIHIMSQNFKYEF